MTIRKEQAQEVWLSRSLRHPLNRYRRGILISECVMSAEEPAGWCDRLAAWRERPGVPVIVQSWRLQEVRDCAPRTVVRLEDARAVARALQHVVDREPSDSSVG